MHTCTLLVFVVNIWSADIFDPPDQIWLNYFVPHFNYKVNAMARRPGTLLCHINVGLWLIVL